MGVAVYNGVWYTGSGSHSSYQETILWEDSSGLEVSSSAGVNITLTNNISLFDAICIEASISSDTSYRNQNIIPVSLIDKTGNSFFNINTIGGSAENTTAVKYVNENTLNLSLWSSSNPIAYFKVIGIRYSVEEDGPGNIVLFNTPTQLSAWDTPLAVSFMPFRYDLVTIQISFSVESTTITTFISYETASGTKNNWQGFLFAEDKYIYIKLLNNGLDIRTETGVSFTVEKLVGYKFGGGSGGGTHVEVTPVYQSGTEIATLTLDNVDYDIYIPDPIDIEGNPAETATEVLTSIKIGDTVYSLPQGGGGGASFTPLTLPIGISGTSNIEETEV